MSDNKPLSTANQEADSFLVRLFVVVFYSVMAVAIVAAIMSNMPASWVADSDTPKHGDSIIIYTQLGWMFFLTIVYLAGRFSEVLVAFGKAVAFLFRGERGDPRVAGDFDAQGLGLDKPKIDRPMGFWDGVLFWMLPGLAFIFSGWCFWILFRIPDAMQWVADLFGR